MEYKFRSLPLWPHPTTDRRQSDYIFKAHFDDTLRKLGYEIDRVDGYDVVIAAGFAPTDMRLDGMPRADARQPGHPGVEISFSVPPNGPDAHVGRKLIDQHGSFKAAVKATHPDTSGYDSIADYRAVMATAQEARRVYATDEYDGWKSNVRAIALTLEALRSCDRWGATQGRQHSGFEQLTAKAGS